MKMKLLTILLFLGVIVVARSSGDKAQKKVLVIDEKSYPKESVVYTSQHDIVGILFPLNSHKLRESSHESDNEVKGPNVAIFFVEADITTDGKRVDQGLYVLKRNVATKLLNNGRDMAAPGDRNNLVYFGASDGVYVYNEEKETADKYGSINDDIINIAKEVTGEVFYILTADKEVYKVTNNGNVKTKVEDVVNAQQIVLDYSNNIYFYTGDKKMYVRNNEGVIKISGLPENPSNIDLIKPPYLMNDGIPCVVDNAAYVIHPNGTSEVYGVEFKPNYKPTAFSMEAAVMHYYAHDKNIYEYNITSILLNRQCEDVDDFICYKKVKYLSLIGL